MEFSSLTPISKWEIVGYMVHMRLNGVWREVVSKENIVEIRRKGFDTRLRPHQTHGAPAQNSGASAHHLRRLFHFEAKDSGAPAP